MEQAAMIVPILLYDEMVCVMSRCWPEVHHLDSRHDSLRGSVPRVAALILRN